MTLNLKKTIFWSVAGIVLIPVAISALFWFMYGLSMTPKAPEMPQITYGEFPFRIEFEYNGERTVYEDIIVCEFEGFSYHGGRYWRKYYKSDPNKGKTTLRLIEIPISADTGDYAIVYYARDNEYYLMGERSSARPQIEISIYSGQNGSYLKSLDSKREINKFLDEYGIKIISIEETPPIKNKFKR